MLIDFGLAQFANGKGLPVDCEDVSSDEEEREEMLERERLRRMNPLREVQLPNGGASDPMDDEEPEFEELFTGGLTLRDRLSMANVEDAKIVEELNKDEENRKEEARKQKRKSKLGNRHREVEPKPKKRLPPHVPSFSTFVRQNKDLFTKLADPVARQKYTSRFSYPRLTDKSTRGRSEAYRFLDGENCPCLGEGWMCEICEEQVQLRAPRGGTPGFRAPEVLLQSLNQTTAIDMWSAGIMLLTIVTGRYPFFTACDDAESLVEVAGVFGTQNVVEMGAKHCGKVCKSCGFQSYTDSISKRHARVVDFNHILIQFRKDMQELCNTVMIDGSLEFAYLLNS
jgi:serine/threonine protein kinase